MIGYVTVGTNDLPKAVVFYDGLFAELGAGRFMEEETFVAWAIAPDVPAFSVCKPYDGNAATVGNGTMIALTVDSIDKVKSVYAKAMELGGTDEGPPGKRMDGFYAGYFRDLDGNKLNVFCTKTDAA
ncbi:MAG: VOC family protein [Gammaproteobacteria bacterium]|jgi:catechol 2,3-dioxygenase-like lactoylglutathione lyase family enzyme|nr:VOC family protein [Gammaproteobacteria bacterium]NNK98932.1 VOC family protein [Xanthomonadales bacterium]